MYAQVSIVGSPIDWASLERFGTAAGNMTQPLGVVAQRLLAAVGAQFATEGGAGGEPWRELTRSYREWKEAKVPGLPKLVGVRRTSTKGSRPSSYSRSGHMKERMLHPDAFVVTPHRLVYSPDSEVAYFHQVGTPKMVARPPVAFPLAEIEGWDGVFIGWLDKLIEETA